ncbi:MAG: hypothetical protein KAX33_00285 [Candidatus Lokiarchaeota archaeon]|nr:hypothetical protein [Candidatus Lokiarchaeota archaeon]MCK4281338.1 hypothetical protein [Candidatus Lokiarchaeota archaeon]
MLKLSGKHKFFLLIGVFQIVLFFIVFFSVNGILTVFGQESSDTTLSYYNSPTAQILAISAMLSVVFSVFAAAFTIKTVGTAAISVLTEREAGFFKAFLVTALGEALAVYGLILALLLWTKIPYPPTA